MKKNDINELGVLLDEVDWLENKAIYNRIENTQGVENLQFRKLGSPYKNLLIGLQGYSDGLAIGKLADKVGINPKIVNTYVKKLVDFGYVERVENQINKKIILVKLTKLGDEIITENGIFSENIMLNVFNEKLSLEEQAEYVSTIKKLIEIYKKMLH